MQIADLSFVDKDHPNAQKVAVLSAPYQIDLQYAAIPEKRVDILSTEPKSNMDMRRFWNEGLQLVKDGLVNTVEMVTHRFPLSKIGEAFQLRNKSKEGGSIHVLIDCSAE